MVADLIVGVVDDVLRHIAVEHLKSSNVVRSKTRLNFLAV